MSLHLAERSKWTFKTSGSGGVGVDFVAATGGAVQLYDPANKVVNLRFGAIGAGLGLGVKLPKIGRTIARLLSSRSISGSGSTFAMRNEGIVFKTDITKGRELTRADFTGVCIIGELGVSTPVWGLSGNFYLFNINKVALTALIANPSLASIGTSLGLLPPLTPSAILVSDGDTRGLGAGGDVYIGGVW